MSETMSLTPQRPQRHALLVATLSALLSLTSALLGAPRAHALSLDPLLHGLCASCDTAPTGLEQPFDGMVKAYGLALAPPLVSPANTIGINAFEVDFAYGMSNTGSAPEAFAPALSGRSAPSTLSTTHIIIRKGLPYSFEIEGQVGYMVNSELWTVGGGLKWAFHEAVAAFPIDFMVRGSANRLVGSTQLDLTTLGLDAAIGTQFGVLKTFNLAPYVAYSPLIINAASATLDATPGVFDAPGSPNAMSNVSTSFVFPRREHTYHRVSVGLRWLVGLVKINPEFVWSPEQYNVNVSFGLHL